MRPTRPTYRWLSIALLVSLLLGSGAAASAASQGAVAASSTMTITAAADAMVKAAYPALNFGALSNLDVRYSPTVRSYLRFSVPVLDGVNITAAELQVYATANSSQSVTARAVSVDSWGETTITYNNAPAVGSALASSPSSFSSGTWLTFSVSSFVQGAGKYSFVLTTSGSNALTFASRETGAYAPRLVLTLASSTTPTPTSGTDWQPSFPIRAAFYYPWFAEAWKQLGIFPYTNFTPSLGYYSSKDTTVLQKHLDMMQYANIQAGIASWWGQGSQTDTKIPGLLQAAAGTNFRWTLYYEMESQGDPSVSQLQNDLVYIRNHYGSNPSYLRINGKFVIFVYSAGNDACGMVDRWKKANTVGAYIVLKVFTGYKTCANHPNNWHQYSPAVAESQQGLHSYSISPGFWQKSKTVRLQRDPVRFARSVRNMVASGAQWQLVTTFSEWGEGTAVEPALEWATTSGYGAYLDALHYNGNMP